MCWHIYRINTHTISAAIHFDSHRRMSMVGLGVKSNESSTECCHEQMFSDCISVLVCWKNLRIIQHNNKVENCPLKSKKETTFVICFYSAPALCNHVHRSRCTTNVSKFCNRSECLLGTGTDLERTLIWKNCYIKCSYNFLITFEIHIKA